MKISELIENAAKKAGGIRALGREMDWNHGQIARARKEERMPPDMAIKMARYIGAREDIAYLTALASQKIAEDEEKILGKLLKLCKGAAAVLTLAAMPMFSAFQPAKLDIPNGSKEASGIYIMNRKRRRKGKKL